MRCKKWPVGVCSWSLRTDVPGVAQAMKETAVCGTSTWGFGPAVEDSSGKVPGHDPGPGLDDHEHDD